MGFSSLAFCCCGCSNEQYWLNTDRYKPTAKCFVKTRHVKTLYIDVVTEAFRNGVLWSRSEEPQQVEELDPVESEFVDDEMVAGNFVFNYEETESSTSEQTNGVDEIVITTTVTTKTMVEITRKLALQYEIKDVHYWDAKNRFGEDVIRAMKLHPNKGEYVPDDFVGEHDNVGGVVLYGWWIDTNIPETVEEFDSLAADPANEVTYDDTVADTVNVLGAVSGNGTHLVLLAGAGERSGYRIGATAPPWLSIDTLESGGSADNRARRLDNANPPQDEYDWHDLFERETPPEGSTDVHSYLSKFSLPPSNYRVDFTKLLPIEYFNYRDNKFKFELIDAENESEDGEIVVFEAEFFVRPTGEVVPGSGTDPDKYIWALYSNGTRGEVMHKELEVSIADWDTDPTKTPFTPPSGLSDGFGFANTSIAVRVREEVIEMLGGHIVSENGKPVDDRWVWVTHHAPGAADGEFFPQLRLRLTFTSDDPQIGYMTWLDIRHPDDGINLECPHDYSCAVFEPYITPEFDVKSFTIAGAVDPPVEAVPKRSWSGCGFTYEIVGLDHNRDLVTTLETARVVRSADYVAEQWDEDANPFYRLYYPPRFHITGEITAAGYNCRGGSSEVPVNFVGVKGDNVYQTAFSGPVTKYDGVDVSQYSFWSNANPVDPNDVRDLSIGTGILNPLVDVIVVDFPSIGRRETLYVDYHMELPDDESLNKTYDLKVEVSSSSETFENVRFDQWPLNITPQPGEFEGYMYTSIGAPGSVYQPGEGLQFKAENGKWVPWRQLFIADYWRVLEDEDVAFYIEHGGGVNFWYRFKKLDEPDTYYLITKDGQEGPFETADFVPPDIDAIIYITATITYETAENPNEDPQSEASKEFTVEYDWATCFNPKDTLEILAGEYSENIGPRPPEDWPERLEFDPVELLPDKLADLSMIVDGKRAVWEIDLGSEITSGSCPAFVGDTSHTNGEPVWPGVVGEPEIWSLPYVTYTVAQQTYEPGSQINGVATRYGLVFDPADEFNGVYVQSGLSEDVTTNITTKHWDSDSVCKHGFTTSRSIKWRKRCRKWSDNEIPTITLSGSDDDVVAKDGDGLLFLTSVVYEDTTTAKQVDEDDATKVTDWEFKYQATHSVEFISWDAIKLTLGKLEL